MRLTALFLAIILAGCTTTLPEAKPAAQCKWPEIPADSGCCRDLNENKVCDTVEFAAEIEAQKQQEYEEAAQKARETAESSGRYKPTIVNQLYANASNITGYRFYYKGDEVVVANNSIVRKLTYYYPLGDRDVKGSRMKVFVNTVRLDFANKTAIAQCIPPESKVKKKQGTPCDDIAGIDFNVGFDNFAFKMPIKWLEEFLYRTPISILPGSHIGDRTATLYKFTDLQNANRITHIWLDDRTAMPLRVEVREGSRVAAGEEYADFFTI